MAVAVKRPVLRSTKANPYPSAPQATRAVRSSGGPRLTAPVAAKKTVGRVGPGAGNKVATARPMKLIRNKRMGLRVGVPKVGLRGAGATARIATARKNLAGPQAKRTVSTNKETGRKIIKTAGKTKIIGKNRTFVITKKGSTIRNKEANTVVRQRRTDSKVKVVKRFGVGTATKADNARAVKVRAGKRARLSYTGPGGRTTTVARRAGSPRKIRVRVTGPGGKTRMTKTIGPKQTTTTRGEKTTTRKTRYVTPERRQKVTPRVGEKGWGRGNTKRKARGNVPNAPNRRRAATGNATTTQRQSGQHGSGYWQNVARWRRLRRKAGARNNLSVTKGQLKATTSRRLS